MNVNLLRPRRKGLLSKMRLRANVLLQRKLGYATSLACGILTLSACSLSDLIQVDNPNSFVTPDAISNPLGAMGLYAGTLGMLNTAYGSSNGDVMASGLLTDEFQDSSSGGADRGFDLRQEALIQLGSFQNYARLQRMRTQAIQAIAAMRKFPADISQPLIARMYAVVGYAELILAERFCSGVPFADIEPGGGAIRYSPGLTTQELLAKAVAHFDTAIALAGADSLRFLHLAQVGKGRALMGMNEYGKARDAVKDVPTGFVYNTDFASPDTNAARINMTSKRIFVSSGAEGMNGINWAAAQDPRVPVDTVIAGTLRSTKYKTATSPITVADGIEARLIEAEADLKDGNPRWLSTLNQLRARLVDGSNLRLLSDTTDPGTANGRVDLIFYERAFWLYATGHRHGDMRRLVRQYQRDSETVFPSGLYTPVRPNTVKHYGSMVVFLLSETNNTNPHFKGCFHKNA